MSANATKRTRTGAQEDTSTAIADEAPVALIFNDITHAVMVASSTDLEDFALGFALSEGVIDSHADRRGADVETRPHGLEVHTGIAPHCFARLKERRRALADPTGCGLYGTKSLRAFKDTPQPLVPPAWLALLADAQMLDAMQAMTAHQPINALTDDLHAAGQVPSDDDAPSYTLEDVGRHNVLDKPIDRLARLGIRPSDKLIVMTSRANFELARRCVQLQVPLLVTISVLFSLVVRHARVSQLTPPAFRRGDNVTRLA